MFLGKCSIAMSLLLTGLAAAPQQEAVKPGFQSGPGIIFVAGGVGGWDLLAATYQWSLPRAGVHHEIRHFDWTHGKGRPFKDLQDTRNSLVMGQKLATLIREAQAEDPYRPIYLIGRSGGACVVLAAAELLAPQTLERVILLSAAVSTAYDLRPALRATRLGIVSFHSRYDQLVLGWGTSSFGTMDRYYGPSAGLRGFRVPLELDAEDRAQYAKLVQLHWNPSMLLEGHTGGHFGTRMPAFVIKEVAPWLKH